MLEHAAETGANAIVAMRYDANLCHGTAVVIEPASR